MQTTSRPERRNTPQPPGPADKIVVGVDGGRGALDAVRWAVVEAGARGAALRIVHAAPYAVDGDRHAAARVRSILGVAYTVARRTAPDVEVSTASSPAGPADALVAAAETAQLLVVGIPHRPDQSSYDVLPTSVAFAVVGHTSCPVAVVRGRTRSGSEPVLVGVDDPGADAAALAVAFAEAALHGVGVVVLQARAGLREHLPGHAAHDEERTAHLRAALAEWSRRYPRVAVDLRTPGADPTSALLTAAHAARVLVVGARRRGATARTLFGSHSRAVLRHSPVPVLVVDPDVRSSTRSAVPGSTAPAPRT
ncbi:universal stress protein [Pseudonocardia lacus]|uniref:universal stress protein n=1 Tax=Pseudonocardia lacus TaxID=2835865 RepID=UPI001BDBB1F8|nr:universal stress protein [Pseudonocardia lacus]